MPSTTATPFGPGPLLSGLFTTYSHMSRPVARESAYTLRCRSCMYAIPLTTIGPAAKVPTPPTLDAALPFNVNVQSFFSWDTFCSEIADPVASRVFAKSPLEYGQDPCAVCAAPTAIVKVPPVATSRLPTTRYAAPRRTRPVVSDSFDSSQFFPQEQEPHETKAGISTRQAIV